MPRLTVEDKERFVQDGYLVVRGLIDAEDVREGLDLVWEHMPKHAEGVERDDPTTWVDKRGGNIPDIGQTPYAKRLVGETAVFDVAEELVGAGALRKGGGFLAKPNFPRADKEWRPARGHLDGYPAGANGVTSGTVGFFTVAATMYVSSVKPQGGGFTVWPGSHRAHADYFRTYPLDVNGADGIHGDLGKGVEFVGEPGDVCFWHHWLWHTAGVNAGDGIRLALITRYSLHDMDMVRRAVGDGNPWTGWRGVAGLGSPAVTP